MKKGIHPEYNQSAKIICACGNTIETGSTKSEIHVEICSACHPFYTGKEKLIDTAGQVDRFKQKMKKTQELQKNMKDKKGKKTKEKEQKEPSQKTGETVEKKTVDKKKPEKASK
ncbi:MAG: 50S ribosomal protein L31 [Candidatus Moranbacteria bacterium]|nr:50S ribosomal protein L31 [Candidatus Moranbacteria bacterium]